MMDGTALNKLLPALFLPVGLGVWLCLLALWRRKWWPVGAAVSVLVVFGCQRVADVLLSSLERPYLSSRRDDKTFEAVYVLGGYLEEFQGEGLEPQWNEAGDRLELGIQMVLQGRTRLLLLSAGGTHERPPEGERAKAVALVRGLKAEQIMVTSGVENTADEANALAELASARGWRRIALVTSAFHMRRAMLLMEQAGVSVTPVATDFHAVGRRSRGSDFLPTGEGLKWSEKALREWMGIAFYRIRGALRALGPQ